MSVGFANAVADGLRHNGVVVSFEPGWETRGNGYTFPNGRPQGLITHHTGSDYGTGLSILVNGRSDLDPPLCNCCTYPDGRIHIIAAQPANHAGAAAGKSLGPFTPGGLFNPRVWGNEVMYPGTLPWTKQQYRSARVLGAVICGILGYKDAEHVRGHYETSGEGKWDPGIGQGSGLSFPMAVFRSETWSAVAHEISEVGYEEDEMIPFEISGKGRKVIICPTGSMAANNRRAWLSAACAAVNGPAWIQVYAQGATDGINPWRWTEKELTPSPQNLVKRVVEPLKDKTTHLVVSWDLTNCPEGGSLLLETLPGV
jgi:hypothetical protein